MTKECFLVFKNDAKLSSFRCTTADGSSDHSGSGAGGSDGLEYSLQILRQLIILSLSHLLFHEI